MQKVSRSKFELYWKPIKSPDEPSDWSVEGRGGLTSWKNLGYIPTEDFDPYGVGPFTRSISRTVEHAYNDFCIAEMARGLGHSADEEKYLERSENWKNMYKADQTSFVNGMTDSPDKIVDTGYVGFLQPKYLMALLATKTQLSVHHFTTSHPATSVPTAMKHMEGAPGCTLSSYLKT
jgi:putative alpha-1,2-mannosidase